MPEVSDLRPYKLRHAGQTAWIIGRGKTEFDYAGLSRADGPVFFINDSVQLEKHLPAGHPSYFAFLDARVARCWLQRKLRSVVLSPEPAEYGENTAIQYQRRAGHFDKDRDLVASNNSLVTCWGTITPVIHFAWYAGCTRIRFIGCDGLAQPRGQEYDARLTNDSQSIPGAVYSQIRASQERICIELGLPFVYVGTPREAQRTPVRFVSFATPKYEGNMLVLADTAAGFGLSTHFEAVSDKGSWQAGVAYKPTFIWTMMHEYPAERLVWVDADAEIQQYPALFWDLPNDLDFAAHWRDGKELLSGTLYFGPTRGAREIVADWCARQKANPGLWDQKMLQATIKENMGRWRVDGLPLEYTFIADTFRRLYPGREPVIEHHQASRKNRNG